jgi:hypothetical protein
MGSVSRLAFVGFWGLDVLDRTARAKAEIGVAIARVIELPASNLQETALRYLWRSRELMDEISSFEARNDANRALNPMARERDRNGCDPLGR